MILILDCETTGTAKIDQVIELAWLEPKTLLEEHELLTQQEDFGTYTTIILNEVISARYKPSCPINPRAYEVHGIGLRELAHAKPSSEVYIHKDITYIIGHNISFDKRMIEQSNPELKETLDNAKYICTMFLAKAVAKSLNIQHPSAKLDDLVSFYFQDDAKFLQRKFHSAGTDVVKTLAVLLKLLQHLPSLETWDCVYNFQESLKKVKK